MSSNIENYKGFVIRTIEGKEHGLFIRSPFQVRELSIYFDDPYCEKYLAAIKNPFRKLYEKIIGNGNIIKNIDNMLNDIDCGGFYIKTICSPIYFQRNFRSLVAVSTNNSSNITEIRSYGYESEFNMCAGECHIERTVFKLRNKRKKIRIKTREQFHYTYGHIIKQIIDTDEI